jgi:hypothetical protein
MLAVGEHARDAVEDRGRLGRETFALMDTR